MENVVKIIVELCISCMGLLFWGSVLFNTGLVLESEKEKSRGLLGGYWTKKAGLAWCSYVGMLCCLNALLMIGKYGVRI